MRYSPDHKQEARQRLVRAGAALAKRQGFAATGLDALTAAAGMTTGAFYSQFKSKPELLRAIVEQEFENTVQAFAAKSPEETLRALARYLSPLHATHPEAGCPIPALGAEIARADTETRDVFETQVRRLHAVFTELLGDGDAAWGVICQAIGGVLVARAMGSAEGRDAVLKGVLADAQGRLKKLAD
ncbi:MAG: bacterial regulatory s, tetR family protein [Moraxellaceae bacterium]|jgi:AcrR family transcriptional regulator|nr:bacterial regulatory s, tetR family protein [Moraxellaceae bacterium]